ncbi:MAG: hypothetical protein J6U54_10700 [Clostridiales bacterium]|nr:hypothetical protein [Clostridiales bacterium]
MADNKYLDYNGLLYFWQQLKTKFLSTIGYDTTNKKITQTKNGTTTDVVTVATLKSDMNLTASDVGLGNVGNFKAVSTVASQGLTDQEKANARANIGAGDSAFSGDFSDLTNVPTTIAGYGITDAKIDSGTITLGSNTITPAPKSTAVTNVAWNSTSNKITKTINGTTTDVVSASTLKTAMAITFSDVGSTPTTLAGYGITDAKIENGVITLGSNSVSVVGVYRYKGSVSTVANLPTHSSTPAPEPGDVYNVTANGKNYAYVEYDSSTSKDVWDDLGGEFEITSITNAEIDTILAS